MIETPLRHQSSETNNDGSGDRGNGAPVNPGTPVFCDILNTRGTAPQPGDSTPPSTETSRRAASAARLRLSH